jgi:TPP-dependent 2-oxoacid decarboxylase
MVKTVSVADYIVERLATEGINHCFGVAGRSALFCTKDVTCSRQVCQ